MWELLSIFFVPAVSAYILFWWFSTHEDEDHDPDPHWRDEP